MLLLLIACQSKDALDGELPYDGPGSTAWADDDVSCESDGDCLSSEVCDAGVCQPERCAGGLVESAPPMGEHFVFQERAELAVLDSVTYEGTYWIDGYQAGSSSTSYDYSWMLDSRDVTDLAGGQFAGEDWETFVVIKAGRDEVYFADGGSIALDFTPVAVAAGDTDGDGVDEVLAISASGDLAVCHVASGGCDLWGFEGGGIDQVDVAAADVDGDALDEVVTLLDYEGYRYLYVTNTDHERTGQVSGYSGYVGDQYPIRVTAADLDGDRAAELVGLIDGGWWGWWDDAVASYTVGVDGEDGVVYFLGQDEVDGWTDNVDVAAGDSDGDGLGEVYILDETSMVLRLKGTPGSMSLRELGELSTTVAPDRVAVADYDGDNVRARLQRGPKACQGTALPVMALLLPPYDADHSDGVSSVQYGDQTSTSDSYKDSVSLGVSMDVGMNPDFFGIFKAKLSTSVSYKTSYSWQTGTSMSVGGRYSLSADPETYGPDMGGVVLSWGCWDAYEYEVVDPGDALGGADGEAYVLTVPTGGSTSLWSLSRYNALAEATGAYPVIENPYKVGDVESYPGEAETLAGADIPSDDLLFTDPPRFTVSDIGSVGWSLSVGENSTYSENTDISMSVSTGVSAFGVSVGGGASVGFGEGYSLTTGTSASFSGSLPSIPDDAATPEDEYGAYVYSVVPWVYVERYPGTDEGEGAFYVQTYTVEGR